MEAKRAVALESLGCKLNQAESEALAWQLIKAGYQVIDSPQEAEVYVLNTCTVTHIADRKSRHLLRWARRNNPQALIVATGCYAQRAPQELAEMGVVDLILDNGSKEHLVETMEANLGKAGNRKKDLATHRHPVFRTRSMIKIQDGCNDFCSFCIVPQVRGRERSLPIERVVAQVKEKVEAGYKEVVLTGTKIGNYGRGMPETNLKGLIERVLTETGVERLRLSSLQPQELTPDLVKLWADPRLCPHLHIPLQSGSDAVLQRMRRRYSIVDYEREISLIREMIPDVAIATDIMVGFPGESEREFEESYRFYERIGFARIHVFPYSLRVGTMAAGMPHQIGEDVKRERSQRMLELAQKSAQRFREHWLGQIRPVLWEKEIEPGIWSGLSDNYLRVFTKSKEPLTNRLLRLRLMAAHNQGLWGELVDGGKHG